MVMSFEMMLEKSNFSADLLMRRSKYVHQRISIEYVLGIQYFEKVLVLDIQYILRRSIGKSINTFRLEIQYPILFSRIFQSFQSKNSKFSRKI